MVKTKGTKEAYVIREAESILSSLWGVVAWVTGVLVSLAVGFGMIGGALTIPYLSQIADGAVVQTAGWIVVILATLGGLLKIVDKISE